MKNIDLDKLAWLTPEQYKVVQRWEQEKKDRSALYDLFDKACLDKDQTAQKKILSDLRKVGSDFCYHGRSIFGTCGSCEEIERILFPEKFENEDEAENFD